MVQLYQLEIANTKTNFKLDFLICRPPSLSLSLLKKKDKKNKRKKNHKSYARFNYCPIFDFFFCILSYTTKLHTIP